MVSSQQWVVVVVVVVEIIVVCSSSNIRQDGLGLAGQHANFNRGKELIEMEAKQELKLALLSTTGDRYWTTKEQMWMLNLQLFFRLVSKQLLILALAM